MNDSPFDPPTPLDDAELAALRASLADFAPPTPELRAEQLSVAMSFLGVEPDSDDAVGRDNVRTLAPRRSRMILQLAAAATVVLVVGVGVKVGIGTSSSDDSLATADKATDTPSAESSADGAGRDDSTAAGAPNVPDTSAASLAPLGEFATRSELRAALAAAPAESRASAEAPASSIAADSAPLPSVRTSDSFDTAKQAGQLLAECAPQIAQLGEPRYVAQLDGATVVVGHTTADAPPGDFSIVLLDDCATEPL
jgi:hypothetical protein